ncbi:MAG TPA: DNA methyltransferase [Solirubrobacteraceae bacterium]|nr:DNA methyltransferase [Solirubrobacteraceae bacterium]
MSTGEHRSSAPHLTHKGNRKDTRYGWLRLTPAYSLTLVGELLQGLRDDDCVLDPFCGTGTTALLCAERGIRSVTTDINPFLIWLTKTKTARYCNSDLAEFDRRSHNVDDAIGALRLTSEWLPPLHQIEKWWDQIALHALGRAMASIRASDTTRPADDLLRIVFCRIAIETAAVSFAHQSMSFKQRLDEQQQLAAGERLSRLREEWQHAAASVRSAAADVEPVASSSVLLLDARNLSEQIDRGSIARVITSPPYPNRMSYIRELRPYLYWLGYIEDAKAAAELDWTAIGGTWGTATSRVGKWQPSERRVIGYEQFDEILEQVADSGKSGPLLSRYIHKYFFDIVEHIDQLHSVMAPGALAYYIVGNSKFYGTLLPVQDVYRAIFEARGFTGVSARAFRKRSSKKELFEYVVEAQRPG